MLSDFTRELTTGAWRWLNPTRLVVAIMGSNRLAAEAMSRADQIDNYTKDKHTTTGMFTVAVPVSNVVPNAAAASATTTTDTMAGETDSVWKYYISGLPGGIVAIGKAPDSELAIAGRDFIASAGGYIFKESPESLGTVSTVSGNPTVCYYCIGGNSYVKNKPVVYGAASIKCNDWDLSVDKEINKIGLPNGAAISVACGDTLSVQDTTVDVKWEENNYTAVQTKENEVLVSSSKADACAPIGSEVSAGSSIAVKKKPQFTFFLKHPATQETDQYTLSYTELVPCCLYADEDGKAVTPYDADPYQPYLQSTYPDLIIFGGTVSTEGYIKGGYFYAEQLKSLIETAGMTAADISKSGLTETGHRWLAKALMLPTGNTIAQSVVISVTDADLAIPSIGVLPIHRDEQRPALYLLYGDTQVDKPIPVGATENYVVATGRYSCGGVLCTRAVFKQYDGTLYASTQGGIVYGKEMTAGGYLYGIAIVNNGRVVDYVKLSEPVLIKTGAEFNIKVTRG